VKTQNWLMLGGAAALVWYMIRKQQGLKGLGDADAAKLDVSKDADLVSSVQHLLALEDHLASSAGKTGESKFVDALGRVRQRRRELMAKLVPENAEGETWCMVKHCCASAEHTREVADKLASEGRGDEARSLYATSEELKNSALAMAATARPGGQCPVCQGG
jgi:hypothetical protein